MSRCFRLAYCVALALLALSNVAWSNESTREMLRRRLENSGTPPRILVANESVHASIALPRFYVQRGFELAWAGRPGEKRIDALVTALRVADAEGLDPRDYHLERIDALRERLRSAPREATDALHVDLDLLCTDAFLLYGSHLVSGFVNPETIDPEWHANRREVELTGVLEKAVESGRVREALESLLPDHPGYAALKRALAAMRETVQRGGWETVAPGPKLEFGVRNARVAQLRRRLEGSGDLAPDGAVEDEMFDAGLRNAVVRFQARHGLDADGVVGPATLAAANVSARQRQRQIVVNLERWRWLPQDLGERYILVNIPAFTAVVIEKGKPVLEMRAVVGRQFRRTPVFSARMTYLVLNPYWEVPPSLAVQDKLPEIRKDPSYLARQNMRVYSGWGAEARELDPGDIDWSVVNAQRFPYRLRQDPGPLNALGRAKFMFPNPHNVYLHDTPQRDHFARAMRSFSSGCIRIETPLELAAYLLAEDPAWSPERIWKTVEKNETTTLTLRRGIAVHLLYWTAWADANGVMHFREDIYGRDRRVSEALRAEPPALP